MAQTSFRKKAFIVPFILLSFLLSNPTFGSSKSNTAACRDLLSSVEVQPKPSASKKSWIRRHPILSFFLSGVAATLGGGLALAPIYPTDFSTSLITGNSPGVNLLVGINDRVQYGGDAAFNQQQWEAYQQIVGKSATTQTFEVLSTEQMTAEERSKYYQALAKHFAPQLFHDGDFSNEANIKAENLPVSARGRVPYKDLPLRFNVDGDFDARNTPDRIENLMKTGDAKTLSEFNLTPTIYAYNSETTTHHYVTYLYYSPFNDFTKSQGLNLPGFPSQESFTHDQDIEVAIVQIDKESQDVSGMLLSQHGYLVPYHPNAEAEAAMRQEAGRAWSGVMDHLNIQLGAVYQPHRRAHRSGSAFDENGKLRIHIARYGHAFSAFDPEAMTKGHGDYSVLLPSRYSIDSDLGTQGIANYQIQSLDLESLSQEPHLFESARSQDSIDGVTLSGQPVVLNDAIKKHVSDANGSPRSNLPGDEDGKLRNGPSVRIATPSKLFERLQPDSSISHDYIFNAEIVPVEKGR